jgi:hypothetical protein
MMIEKSDKVLIDLTKSTEELSKDASAYGIIEMQVGEAIEALIMEMNARAFVAEKMAECGDEGIFWQGEFEKEALRVKFSLGFN